MKEVRPDPCERTVETLELALEEARKGELVGVLIIGETTNNQVMTFANFADADRVIGYLERLKYRMLLGVTDS